MRVFPWPAGGYFPGVGDPPAAPGTPPAVSAGPELGEVCNSPSAKRVSRLSREAACMQGTPPRRPGKQGRPAHPPPPRQRPAPGPALPARSIRWPEPWQGGRGRLGAGGYLVAERLVDVGSQLFFPPLRLQLHGTGRAPGARRLPKPAREDEEEEEEEAAGAGPDGSCPARPAAAGHELARTGQPGPGSRAPAGPGQPPPWTGHNKGCGGGSPRHSPQAAAARLTAAGAARPGTAPRASRAGAGAGERRPAGSARHQAEPRPRPIVKGLRQAGLCTKPGGRHMPLGLYQSTRALQRGLGRARQWLHSTHGSSAAPFCHHMRVDFEPAELP